MTIFWYRWISLWPLILSSKLTVTVKYLNIVEPQILIYAKYQYNTFAKINPREKFPKNADSRKWILAKIDQLKVSKFALQCLYKQRVVCLFFTFVENLYMFQFTTKGIFSRFKKLIFPVYFLRVLNIYPPMGVHMMLSVERIDMWLIHGTYSTY